MTLSFLLIAMFTSCAWQSALYPNDWEPGYEDAAGRFLHDFSYAGYHRGECELPAVKNSHRLIVDVTKSPFNADNTGKTDCTRSIQQAIDFCAERESGGIVYLPEGTYKVRPQAPDTDCSILIPHSKIVLLGEGTHKTFIYNCDPEMRGKSVIWIRPRQLTFGKTAWYTSGPASDIGVVKLAKDVGYPTKLIHVEEIPDSLEVGDWVLIRADCTPEFIAEHKMSSKWTPELEGVAYYRQIAAIDKHQRTIEIHTPTRYYLKTRDNARIVKVISHIEEVGLQNFSIGMRESTRPESGSMDHTVNDTTGYQAHNSYLIRFNHSVNCWLWRVSSYKPETNNISHMLSNGILLDESHQITVRDCSVSNPQYKGGGGNGYCYVLSGSDCLIDSCMAQAGRHNYSFKRMRASGNVILDSKSVNGQLPVDFHMHLSMGNLIDCMRLDGDYISATYRYSGKIEHGHTTTESVIWNTWGSPNSPVTIVESSQWKWGYVIGTQGYNAMVNSDITRDSEPKDYVEGIRRGRFLTPRSLYKDQLKRRLDTRHSIRTD